MQCLGFKRHLHKFRTKEQCVSSVLHVVPVAHEGDEFGWIEFRCCWSLGSLQPTFTALQLLWQLEMRLFWHNSSGNTGNGTRWERIRWKRTG
jgi:hypothetical protein